MSVISAPPRKDLYMLWGAYGQLGGVVNHPRGRLWLLADSAAEDARVTVTVAWNHPTTGQVEYQEMGDVYQARLKTDRWAEVHTAHGMVSMVAAPCVCGAGAVGQALPDPGRISLSYLNPHGRPQITFQ